MNDRLEIQQNAFEQFSQAQQVLAAFIAQEKNFETIAVIASTMAEAISKGKKIFSCGNGGSHCDAQHFAEEMTGRFRENRRALPAIAIADPAHITCVANDYGFEQVFSRYLEGLGNPGDMLLAISTSGNSMNIVRAIEKAKELDIQTVLLSGNTGGILAGRADHELIVPHVGYSDRIQEIHIKIIHVLIQLIEELVTNNKS